MKILLLSLVIIIIPTVSAIVILPPVIYFVTLSIASFIGNIIIGLLAWVALSGLLNKQFFGKTLSELISYIFSTLKNIFIAIIAMIAGVFIASPIEIISVLAGALIAAIICCFLLYIANYSELRAVENKRKKKILKSNTFFSVIVFLLFSASAFLSIETQILPQDPAIKDLYARGAVSGILEEKEIDAFEDIAGMPVSGVGAPLAETSKTQLPSQPDDAVFPDSLDSLWLYPVDSSTCIVNIGNKTFNFTPKQNCYLLENNIPVRIYCPIEVTIEDISQKGMLNVSATGSCSGQAEITVENKIKVN